MSGNLANLLRLWRVGRSLARHGALNSLTEKLPAGTKLPLPARCGIGFLGLFGNSARVNDRPGERLAAALAELGPSFIKLGQALSVRPDLVGEAMAEDLGRLRDRLPPFPAEQAIRTIEDELGQPLESLFAEFEREPVAAASIAQVHFARLHDDAESNPSGNPGKEVAVKVLRPGIEAAFQRDLDLFYWVAGMAERYVPEAVRLRPVEVVNTLARSMTLEMDLRFEAAAASELRDNFVTDTDMVVPAPHWPGTARRVMTSERMRGISIDDREALRAAGHDLPELAAKVIRTFLRQTLRDGYFHADLHQGNLFVQDDGKLAAVDFGIMGRIDMPTRRFMAEMLHAFVTGNWRRAAEVHFEAGYVPAHHSIDDFAHACRSIGEPIMGRAMSEISIGRLLAQLFQITETFDMRTQPQLLLLQKTMVTVEGVARSLDPAVNFWTVSQPVIEEWIAANLSPEAMLAETAREGIARLRRLPKLFDDLAEAAARLARGEVVLDPATTDRLAKAGAARRQPLLLAATLGIWVLALSALAVILFG